MSLPLVKFLRPRSVSQFQGQGFLCHQVVHHQLLVELHLAAQDWHGRWQSLQGGRQVGHLGRAVLLLQVQSDLARERPSFQGRGGCACARRGRSRRTLARAVRCQSMKHGSKSRRVGQSRSSSVEEGRVDRPGTSTGSTRWCLLVAEIEVAQAGGQVLRSRKLELFIGQGL